VLLEIEPEARIEETPEIRRKRDHVQARSPLSVLLWLTARQGAILLGILAGLAVVTGPFVPPFGQVLWPIATLLLGVACGTAVFAQEQSDLSYQLLAAQHLPLNNVWKIKTSFWLAAAALLALVAVGGGGLAVLVRTLATMPPRPVLEPGQNPFDFAPQEAPAAPVPAGFELGTLFDLMGPVLFFGAWLAYGFVMGQLFVMFCRKNLMAVLLASVASVCALGLWLPSVLCRGMPGWPLWLPPLLLLAATRHLMRSWAGGRIKERKPLAAVSCFAAVALAWVVLSWGLRALEIPDTGEPMDRDEYRASVPSGRKNPGGQRVQDAIGELGGPGKEEGPWLARLTEAARLPLGVVENPLTGGQAPMLRHLDACRIMTDKLRVLAEAAQAAGKPAQSLEHLSNILFLSRTLRNKAFLSSYVAGVEIEASALNGLDRWLALQRPSEELVGQALALLKQHAARTPDPLACLETECYRAGDLLQVPVLWAFHPGGRSASGRIPERWLANWVAFSLEVPWEKERRKRLWRAVWVGLFRTLKAPPGRLPDSSKELATAAPTTEKILRHWSPANEGPDSSMTAARLARLLDASWLSDERLFVPVLTLRAAAARSRWRVDSRRLELALLLYQIREKKAAARLEDVVPRYVSKLPVDPYTGEPFHYRISKGETIEVVGDGDFQGRKGRGRGRAKPGQGIVWSTGPDAVDDGGRKHGGQIADDAPDWRGGGIDLVRVVPAWP
jgi:hypothetical protein